MINIHTDKIQPPGSHNPITDCVRTACVNHLINYPYTHFNPMQSMFIPHLEQTNANFIIVSGTGAGKTTLAELTIAQMLFESKLEKKALYLAPMKALAEEKMADWSDKSHTFSQYKITVLTGDYELNADKANQLQNSNIILCTSEMLDSKTRNYMTNTWLHNIGVIVIDEAHLIGSKERGPRLETALMRFNEYNSQCQFVFMSATVPNVDDYLEWIKKLTNRETILIKSNYRPCKLNMHYKTFDDSIYNRRKRYDELELARMQKSLEIIAENPTDQFLVFTGNKTWGRKFTEMLKKRGFKTDFHNADLGLVNRRKLESDFNDGALQILVSSSTLAWGVNVNARRVILAHTAYGMEEMDVADIWQACGRAGRIKFHNEGDAYIIIQGSKEIVEIQRIEKGFNIKSQLNDPRTLMFHVVNEINTGNVRNKQELYAWYERSLAAIQNDILTEETCSKVLLFLKNKRMIWFNEEISQWETTQLGNITSLMYMDPLDVYDWFSNFTDLTNIGVMEKSNNYYQVEETDIKVCWALANIYSYKPESGGFLSNAEKDASMVIDFGRRIGYVGPQTKIAAAYWYMLQGIEPDECLRSLYFALLNDMERVITTLKLIHANYGKYLAEANDIKGWRFKLIEWDILLARLKYGVPRKYVPLVVLPDIGRVYAERLYSFGIKDKHDIVENKDKVIDIIGLKRAEKLYNKIGK